MNLRSCPREPEVKQLLQRGHWPDACEPELRTHIVTCATCSESIQLAELFQTARSTAMHSAPRFDSAGSLWWRAQLRRRNAALESIARPVRTAQIFAAAICLLATLSFMILHANGSWLSQCEQLIAHPSQLLSLASTQTGWGVPLLATSIGTLTVLAAVALLLASEAKETRR